jgi:small-conductance mechanosensitive channel
LTGPGNGIRPPSWMKLAPALVFASIVVVAWVQHHYVALGITIGVLILGPLFSAIGQKIIASAVKRPREYYRDRKLLSTLVFVVGALIIALAWGRLVPHHGTFFGLIGAGLAVALREPLLSIAGRIAIFSGRIYDAGDRIQIGDNSGDVIDIGFFYTRMLEIGNWIHGDQYSGRILQFPNAQIFGAGVFNYTRDFQYIWDEVSLNITYNSNIDSATKIMLSAGTSYTDDFLKGAKKQLLRMQQYFLVPDIELEPQVYLHVTTNWVGLTMRYVVDPKKRRAASTYLYRSIFDEVIQHEDIEIGTDTMEITYKKASPSSPNQERKTFHDKPDSRKENHSRRGEAPKDDKAA